MKLPQLISTCALVACLAWTVRAQEAAAPAAPAPAASRSSADADLKALIQQVRAKLAAGKRSEADLAPELAAFDALAAKYKGERTDAVAAIAYMKGLLYLQVLNDTDKALPIFAQIQKDFPGTDVAHSAARAAKQAQTVVLASGTPAPDFTVGDVAGGAGTLTLSQFKGKVVILDFWSTWCGPCQMSMPHLEKVYNGVKGQNVAVVGICSWDTKDAYKKWLLGHKDTYTFTLAMDPAERNGDESVATKLYGVTGIPTTYVIGKDGKVAAAIVGFGGDGDRRIEDALRGLGVSTL